MGTKQADQSCPDSDADVCHCCHPADFVHPGRDLQLREKGLSSSDLPEPSGRRVLSRMQQLPAGWAALSERSALPWPHWPVPAVCMWGERCGQLQQTDFFSFSYSAQFNSVWYVCTQEGPYVFYPISQRFPQQWPFHILSRKIVKHFVFLCLSPPGIVVFFWKTVNHVGHMRVKYD